MDYNKIKTFCVVAENQSFTKAARILYRTQSAVTQQIKLLEDDFGFLLFQRKNARIYLSKEGHELYKFAQKELRLIDEKCAELKNNLSNLEGVIKIGMLAELALEYLPDLIKSFKKKFPKCQFEIQQSIDKKTEQKLLANEIDFGFICNFYEKDLFQTYPVYKEEFILVSSSIYLKNNPVHKPSELLDCSLLDFGPYFPCLSLWFKKNCPNFLSQLHQKNPDIVVEDDLMIKKILMKDLGIAMCPRFLIETELKSGKLKQLLKEKNSVFATVDIAHKKRGNLSVLQTEFLNFVLGDKRDCPIT